jgi:hypothetical protein
MHARKTAPVVSPSQLRPVKRGAAARFPPNRHPTVGSAHPLSVGLQVIPSSLLCPSPFKPLLENRADMLLRTPSIADRAVDPEFQQQVVLV